MKKEKIVLAYSGGLDTSVAIKWLQDEYNYEVVAVIADLGEGKDLKALQQKALDIGAIESHVLDLKEEFSNEYLAKALKANALYEDVYPLISALSRPLIAKKLVDIAKTVGAAAVSHGCTGKGNDQVRFDLSIKSLNPALKIVAPVRVSPMSREAAILYAKEHNIPVSANVENPYSIDLNLWGRSCECGVLEDPWVEPPENAYALTAALEETPDKPETIMIEFKHGIPVALNEEALSFCQIIEKLNQLAGAHGVGRIDHVENRLVGIKSREIYEAPAAMVLINAHKALESLCLTRDVSHFKKAIEKKFETLVYDGFWYSPLFSAVNAFIETTQEKVSGLIKIKLYKGHATIIGRQSKSSLYQYELATYNSEDQFDHEASEGFIKILSLPLEMVSHLSQAENQS